MITESDFQKLFDRGYKVIPIGVTDKGFGKRPLIKDWQNVDWSNLDPYEIVDEWFTTLGTKITGMGAILDPRWGGLCTIDIDSDDEEIIDRIKKYFNSPVIKKGRRGITLFYKSDGKDKGINYKYKVPSGGYVEVYYKMQTVLPPSWHSTNDHGDDIFFNWAGLCGLEDIDVDDLPVLEHELILNLQSLISGSSAQAVNMSLPKQSQFRGGQNRTIQINQVAGALVGDNPDPDLNHVVRELIAFDDKMFPGNSFFLDPSKAHNRTTSKLSNCMGYLSSIMRTIQNRSGQFTDLTYSDEIASRYQGEIVFNNLTPVDEIISNPYEGLPNFDPEIMDDHFKEMVNEIAFSFGVPKQGLYLSLLCAMGASLQGNTRIFPSKKWDFFVRPNLGVCLVSQSGSKKSFVLSTAIKELEKINKELKEINSQELLTKVLDLETRLEVLSKEKRKPSADVDSINEEMKKIQIELMNKSSEVKGTTFIWENGTVQKAISEISKNQDKGFLVIKDEMKQMMMEMKKTGNEDARTFYMKGLDGNTWFENQTLSRGTDRVDNLFLSVLVNVQPSVLNVMIQDLHNPRMDGNDGFLQRLIMVPFGEPVVTDNDDLDIKKFNDTYQIFRKAWESDSVDAHIAQECTVTYKEMVNKIKHRALKYGDKPISGFLNKQEGLLQRFSYIYEYLNSKGEIKPKEIGYKALNQAMKLLDYLAECSKHVFSIKDSDEELSMVKELARLLSSRHFTDGQTQADMWKQVRGSFPNARAVMFYNSLHELEIKGYVRQIKKDEKSVLVYINPRIYTL